jgi:hypothetical protein
VQEYGGPGWKQLGSPYPTWYDEDDGTWEAMTTPGNAGYGIIVWDASMDHCRHAISKGSLAAHEPLLTPALCTWHTLTTRKFEYVDYDILTPGDDREDVLELDHDVFVEVPLVKVTNLEFPDRMSLWPETLESNLWMSDRQVMRDASPFWRDTDSHDTSGVLPLWCVVPIHREYYLPWKREIMSAWTDWPGLMWTDLNCTHQNIHVESKDPANGLWYGRCTLESCVCMVKENREQVEAFKHARPPFEDAVEYHYEDVWSPTWTYAVERHREGWAKAQSIIDSGDAPCSSSLLQAYSPFSGSRSSLASTRQAVQAS